MVNDKDWKLGWGQNKKGYEFWALSFDLKLVGDWESLMY